METNKEAQRYTNIGKDGEDFISDLSRITFLNDWTFPNTINPKTNKEICDILIAFDNSITIIQVKNTKPKYKNDLVTFKTQDINKNLKQLDGAYRYFKDNDDKSLECVNLHGQIRSLQIKDFTSYRLISAFTSKEEYDGMNMFKRSPRGLFVHCFDRAFSLILFQELDTHSDLINYLDKRESFLNQDVSKLINGREEELLASYMFNIVD